MRARTLNWLSLPCALAVLAGCPTTPEPVDDPAPEVLSFTVEPTGAPEANLVKLRWRTANADAVSITDSNRGAVSGVDGTSGQLDVPVEKTTLFVLTASADDGRSATAIAQVRRGPGDADLLLVAQPSLVAKGEAVTLAWAASDGDTVKLSTGDGTMIDTQGQTRSGTVVVRPESDTTYVLEAGGRRAEATVRIKPGILRFEATPRGAVPGQPLVLSWQTSGATRLVLDEPERAVLFETENAGEIVEGSHELPIPLQVDESRVFNFRLRVEGTSPEAVTERTLTVYVAGQTQIVSFDVPRYARTGGTFTASWRTAEADHVEILANGVRVYESLDPATAAQGSTTFPTPAEGTVYRLKATSFRGAEDSETRTLSPVGTTQVVSVQATPNTFANGGEPVVLSWNIPGARRVRVTHTNDGIVFSGSGDQLEQRSITLYPNATGQYLVEADNTLGDAASATAAVSVTTPATFGISNTGTIVAGSTVDVSVPAVPGAPQTFIGFPHSEVDVANAPGAFLDIRDTGTAAPFTGTADTLSTTVRADFETWLYGERIPGTFVVFTDGVLTFSPFAKAKGTNQPIPGDTHEPNLVAPFWDDLVFGPESALLWEVRGDAPNKLLIVQWDQVEVKGEVGSRLTFQAQIHQTGAITFAYRDVVTTTATPTIGVQGPQHHRGVSHPSIPSSGDTLGFFGERGPTLTLSPDQREGFSGFVVINKNYLRVPLTLERFLGPGELYVSEALVQPHASLGTDGEWFEVTNLSPAPVDLSGWTIQTAAGTHVIASSTLVPAGGVVVLGAEGAAASNGGVNVDYVYGDTLPMDDAASFVSVSKAGYTATLQWPSSAAGVTTVQDAPKYLTVGDTAATAPHAISCAGTTAFGDPSLNQLGSPGLRKGCFGYRLESRPVSYRDISKTGVRILSGSVNSAEVSLAGTAATAFGAPVTTLNVSRHGFASFNATGSTSYTFSSVVAPSAATPDATAALFAGRSLSFSSDSVDAGVYVERIYAGEDPQNPTAHWIVQWHHLRAASSSFEDLNFQLKVFDDGTVEYHYGHMLSGDSNLYALGGSNLAWLEHANGSAALVLSRAKPTLRPFTAYRFISE